MSNLYVRLLLAAVLFGLGAALAGCSDDFFMEAQQGLGAAYLGVAIVCAVVSARIITLRDAPADKEDAT